MSHFRLRTLGAASLSGASGAIPLEEPRLVAFLVMLALAGDEGAAEGDLLRCLTPEATAEHGRVELSRLATMLRSHLGDEASVVRTSLGYAIAPGRIMVDVRVLQTPAESECDAFMAGFRLPGSPEFTEWLVEQRGRVEPTAAPVSRWRPSRRAAAVAALALLVLIASAGAAYLLIPRSIAGFSIGDAVLLADVRNETGDPELDAGLRTAATITLQQSGRLRVYSRSRLAGIYSLMQITNRDTTLTFELAQEVAERDNVRFVLGLQVSRAGDRFQVTARLADVSGTEKTAEETATAASREEVLSALDAVLLVMRRRLGESRAELHERRLPLPQVTTASLAALRSYAEGTAAWDRGDYALAGELWMRAVDLDTGFAMAYGALGGWHYYHHSRAGGERYHNAALARAHRLTERERLRILEAQAEYLGLRDSSLVLSGMIAARYPSVSTWYNHGTGLLSAQRRDEAIAALETALSFDSTHVNSHLNIATATKGQHRMEDALVHYARAGRLDSLSLYRNNINHEWGSSLVIVGRLAEAESAFRKMAQRPSLGDRALGLRSLGYLALWRGRAEESITMFGQASAASQQMGSGLSEARNRLLTAASYRVAGRELDAGREIDRAMSLMASPSFEPLFLAMIATSCARLGRADDTRTVLSILRARMSPENGIDSASEAYVSGLVLLAAQRPADALAAARRAGRLPFRIPLLMLEAEAFAAMGHADSARVRLERVLDEPGFGVDAEDDWLHGHLLLGDLQLAQGDTAGAQRSYERLVQQWRDSPTALPDLVMARSQLVSLARERR
ncbi:MAG TPA: tetratricopeptide repeat protein [Gemmatimonadaceae bacterium]|nr:tetratricopeptide repeat protein [Gemmatimonadaceae bacterium]